MVKVLIVGQLYEAEVLLVTGVVVCCRKRVKHPIKKRFAVVQSVEV